MLITNWRSVAAVLIDKKSPSGQRCGEATSTLPSTRYSTELKHNVHTKSTVERPLGVNHQV